MIDTARLADRVSRNAGIDLIVQQCFIFSTRLRSKQAGA